MGGLSLPVVHHGQTLARFDGERLGVSVARAGASGSRVRG
jgi:hypothetical protein